jgi:hypothetical protein
MKSCREKDADKLYALLVKSGPCTLRAAANALNRGVAYTRSLLKENYKRFDTVLLCGHVGNATVAAADPERPLGYFVYKAAKAGKERP